MSRWIAAVILVLSALPAGAAPGGEAVPGPGATPPRAPGVRSDAPLTLPQAIALALTTSPRLEAARAGVAASRAGRRMARAEGKPTAQFNGPARIQRPKIGIRQPTDDLDLHDIPIVVDRTLNDTYTIEPGVQAQQPVYTGGRVSSQKRAAGRGERAALARLEAEGQRLVFDVTEAYLNVLEARQQVGVEGSLRELNEERLNVARVRLAAGAGILLEGTQAESDLALAVQGEIEAQARARQAEATFNSLIGRPVTAPVVLADLPATAAPVSLPSAQTPPPTPERLRELGLERPDLRALREDVHQAEAQVAGARAARRPQFSLTSSSLLRIPETLMGTYSWGLGISLVHSLLDGGRSRAGIQAAQAERARRAAVLVDSERRMEAEVEGARAALEAAERRLAAEQQRVAAASGALDLAVRRREAGAAAPIEVTEAQTTFTRAQAGALTARFEAARARVRLAFAAGLAFPETVTATAALPGR